MINKYFNHVFPLNRQSEKDCYWSNSADIMTNNQCFANQGKLLEKYSNL